VADREKSAGINKNSCRWVCFWESWNVSL